MTRSFAALVLASVTATAQPLGQGQPAGIPAARQAEPTPQPQAGAGESSASVAPGLADLDGMTFGCPKAGLNAAAREAAKVPSQGTYQFSFFRIVSDSHHAAYEVHFKSNYVGEPDLQYCVAVYCQQGWDPKTTRTSVVLMGDPRQATRPAAHAAHCGEKPAPPKKPAPRKKPATR